MLTTTWSLIPSDYISISWKLETIRQLSTVVHNDTYDKNNNEIKRRKIKLKIEKEITQMQYIYITRIPGIQKIIIITSLMMLLLYTNREVILIDDIPQIQMKLHQHMSSHQARGKQNGHCFVVMHHGKVVFGKVVFVCVDGE